MPRLTPRWPNLAGSDHRLAPDPAIRFGEAAHAKLFAGMAQMTGLLSPTLGPTARTVAITRLSGSGAPEILDDAGTVAKRTIQLADPFEDMGAMLIRDMVWRLRESVGDGAATAAVLATALTAATRRYVTAGGNPMAVKRGVERGLALATAELRRQARPIDGAAAIAGAIAGALREPNLAAIVGEVIDSVGPDGAVLVELSQSTMTTHEYIDGIRWSEGFVSPHFAPDEDAVVRLINPRIFATDMALERAEQIAPVVEACVRAKSKSLLVVAAEVKDSALALLLLNQAKGVLERVVAVRAPSVGGQQTRIVEDIAAQTGGRCVRALTGERLADVDVEHLGSARQAWASRANFGILGGHGAKAAIRQRLVQARAELAANADDRFIRAKTRERIAKLSGSAAVIRVGGHSKTEQEDRQTRLEMVLTTARLAAESGGVPGGGAAYLTTARALLAAADRAAAASDEAVGLRALAEALAAPMRALADNAGLDAREIVATAHRRRSDRAFDTVAERWVDPWATGLIDPLAVCLAALEAGVSAGLMALTTDAIVRRVGRKASRRLGRD